MATTKYCYDGSELVYESDSGGGYREYYHGPEGLLSMYDSDGSARRYHFFDGLGSTSELTNESGTAESEGVGTFVDRGRGEDGRVSVDRTR